MRVRRCAILFLEPRESVSFDLGDLLRGGDGLRREQRWLALAPHLDAEVEVTAEEREALGLLPASRWCAGEALAGLETTLIRRLLDKGLLIGDGPDHAAVRAADEKIRATHWRPLSAAFHRFSRWRSVDAGADRSGAGLGSFAEMVATLGEPPPHLVARGARERGVALDRPAPGAIDEVLAQRVTCRNWDTARALDRARLSRLMHRVFAAQAVFHVTDRAAVLKKTSPSGGGLHPTEAYLLVRHVTGLAPGLYHYHAGEHALHPLPWPIALAGPGETDALPDSRRQAFAAALLAGQQWFAGAHVLVLLTTRFRRQTWKYRAHAKAYKAALLDAGHLSQTLYLTAAEMGLGAFITAAVNDVEIEQALGLDPLEEGVVAAAGFGWRGDTRAAVEFDPLRRVWQDWGTKPAG
jgi:putative peptide maturation dehydrogenase